MVDQSGQKAIGDNLADLQEIGTAAKQVGARAGQAGSDAVGQARDVAHEAQARGASLAGAIGERATGFADEQKGELADKIENMAKAVHKSGEQLEGQQDWIAHQVERGAAELSILADTLRTNDLQTLFGNLSSLAQRQPALFVGASIAAGFAISRVGKGGGGGCPEGRSGHCGRRAMSGARSTGGVGVGELLGNLVGDLQDLVRGEMKLARVELDQKLDHVLIAAIWLLGGALLAFAGLVVLLEGLAAILALWLPIWGASLIIGAVIVVAGGLFARAGLAKLSLRTLKPDRTAASLRKDARLVKEHI